MLNFFQTKNQIVLISLEYSPLVKAGAKGNYNRDFITSFKKQYPNKDIRVIIPYYDNDTFKNTKDTGIEFNFNYGVQNSSAEVFKTNSEGIIVYCIKSEVFSNYKSPCEIKNYDLLKASSAFSSSALIALEELSKDKKENFNPNVLHLIDWQTSLNGKKRKSTYLKNKKIIHTIHNFKTQSQGNIMPFYGMLLFFEKDEVEYALKNQNFYECINALAEEINPNSTNISTLAKFDLIAKNIENIKIGKNYDILNSLNDLTIELFPYKNYDENYCYNCLAEAISECSYWVVNSEKYYSEIITNPKIYAPSLEKIIQANKNKGIGVLIGANIAHNTNEKGKIEFPYTKENFEIKRKENKKFLQNCFANKEKDKNKKFITNKKSSRLLGELQKNDNSILFLCSSKFDTSQKATDEAMLVCKTILDLHPETQFIFAAPNYLSTKDNTIKYFIDSVIKEKKYQGRVLLINDLIPINQYLASCDFFLMPNRYESEETSQFRAMKYGCIPIARNTGVLSDSIVSFEENTSAATGFKTKYSYYETQSSDIDYLQTIQKAIKVYKSDKKMKNIMIKNAMEYDSSWNKSAQKINALYEK